MNEIGKMILKKTANRRIIEGKNLTIIKIKRIISF